MSRRRWILAGLLLAVLLLAVAAYVGTATEPPPIFWPGGG